MKRTLLLAALVAASASAFAADPQPSFNDNAPVQAQAAREATIVKGDLPKPSFIDTTEAGTDANTRSPDTAIATNPAPSFAG